MYKSHVKVQFIRNRDLAFDETKSTAGGPSGLFWFLGKLHYKDLT